MRPENFVGVGQQNFSQTNTDEASVSPKTETSEQGRDLKSDNSLSKSNYKFNRYAVHSAVILAIIGVALIGKINAGQAISTKGSGSTKDQTSIIATGAILVNNTQSVITQDVSQQARDLTNMNALATAGDDFLANKSSVIAIGAQSREILSYKVKQGDTLSLISAKFNITTDTIKWANDIADENNLKPDTNLVILPVNGIMHTVQAGDDVLALAERYQSNASLIENFNGLEGKAPEQGLALIIPDGIKYVPPVVSRTTGINNVFLSSGSFSGNGNSYAYGQCTWYVASRRSVPSNWGNANSWYYNARASGFGVGRKPVTGAIAWTAVGYYGHIAYVEGVSPSGDMVTVSEMNYNGNWNRVTRRTVPASDFLYIY